MDSFEEIKQLLHQFSEERDWEQFHDARNLALSVALEAAELNEAFLWKHSEEEVPVEKIREELADVLNAAFLLADHYHLDIKQIMLDKLAVNAQKYPVDQARGRALKYTELAAEKTAQEQAEAQRQAALEEARKQQAYVQQMREQADKQPTEEEMEDKAASLQQAAQQAVQEAREERSRHLAEAGFNVLYCSDEPLDFNSWVQQLIERYPQLIQAYCDAQTVLSELEKVWQSSYYSKELQQTLTMEEWAEYFAHDLDSSSADENLERICQNGFDIIYHHDNPMPFEVWRDELMRTIPHVLADYFNSPQDVSNGLYDIWDGPSFQPDDCILTMTLRQWNDYFAEHSKNIFY